MAEQNLDEVSENLFCGNCGTGVAPEATACSQCGERIEQAHDPLEFRDGYLPYCRACGVTVAREAALHCTKCGVTPLCREHFYPSTRSCALCPPVESDEPEPTTRSALPNNPWPRPAVSIPCPRCGARISQGVDYCPNCGVEQECAGADSQYAGFLIRFFAFVIDNLILFVAGTLLFEIVEIPALGLLITIPYYVGFTYKIGQTPGKKFLGLHVIDENESIPDFRRVLLREVVAKSVPSMLLIAGAYSIILLAAGYIAGAILLLGYLWILRDENKRGFHDYIGGTYVIKKDRR